MQIESDAILTVSQAALIDYLPTGWPGSAEIKFLNQTVSTDSSRRCSAFSTRSNKQIKSFRPNDPDQRTGPFFK